MCLLSVFPSGIQPVMDDLREGCQTNTDGFGYAIAVPKERRIIRFRSMDDSIALARFEADRRDYPDGPAMFHSRWGTMGEVSKFNCHPFRVGIHRDAVDMITDPETVLGHNGVLYTKVNTSDEYLRRMSDTRFFAEVIFPQRYRRLDRPTVRKQFERFIGHANKMVIITVNPRYASNLYILNEEAGHWTTDGIWHSNYGYQKTVQHGWQASSSSRLAGIECEYCGEGQVIYGICIKCNTCNWCGQYDTDCECLKDNPATSQWRDKKIRTTCERCRYSLNYCQCGEPCSIYALNESRFSGETATAWCRTHHVMVSNGALSCRSYRSASTDLIPLFKH